MRKVLAILCSAFIILSAAACEESGSSKAASFISSTASVSSSTSEASQKVYSDKIIDAEFKGLSNQAGLDGEMFVGLTVKNKSSKNITVTLKDVYIDGTMMQTGSGVPLTIVPGKSGTGEFFGKNSTKPDAVKKVGFKIYLFDDSTNHLETTKQIEIKLK